MGKQETALVKFDETQYPVLIPERRAEIVQTIHDNLGNTNLRPLDLPRVTVPPGGGSFWTVRDLDNPDGRPERELRGVIVHTKKGRTYWSKGIEEGGGGTPPDCFSDDGVMGTGNPGGACAQCPFALFGSDPKGGKAQACKQKVMLFLLEPEHALPTVVIVPPSSLGQLQDYMLGLASKVINFKRIETRIGLRKTSSKTGGPDYSEITFAKGAELSPDAAVQINEYASAMRAVFDQAPIDVTPVAD